MNINKYILEIVVFVCGGVLMIFELVGSRILGPYFGTSIFVWTSLIGVIMGSLSLGYFLGGKLADKKPTLNKLSAIIFLTAIFMAITFVIKEYLLNFLQIKISDVRYSSVVGSLILFMPVSILLGIVSPYAVKLKLYSLNNSGETVGILYAISTLGSIFGTFLAGFYLIPFFGTNKLLLILIIILILTSLLISAKYLLKFKLMICVIVILSWFINDARASLLAKNGRLDLDTEYNRIWIYDVGAPASVRPVRVMGINNENHSAMFLDGDELVNEYTKYYDLAEFFKSDFKKTLMLGGAAYSYPKHFLQKYPSASIDVVEIDPKVTDLAKKYFKLKDDPRLNIFHQDGRVFLNKAKMDYDVIFIDAFGSKYSVPYQLTTKEAVEKIHDNLVDDGIVIMNLISAINGKKGQFLRAEYETYKSIFSQVYIFPVQFNENGEVLQNIMLVALKSRNISQGGFFSENIALNRFLGQQWKAEISADMPILSDDFAPVDHYISNAI